MTLFRPFTDRFLRLLEHHDGGRRVVIVIIEDRRVDKVYSARKRALGGEVAEIV